MTAAVSIGLVGCGKMGRALLDGWTKSKSFSNLYVIEPAGLPLSYNPDANVTLVETLPQSCDIIVLAVKPQIMGAVCSSLNLAGNIPVLSIAAGQTLANFAGYFGPDHPVIRAMPNTPAAIGQSATVAVASPTVTTPQKTLADTLLSSVGHVEWITDESMMDAITALSGSGPAYVFYMIESLTRAGIACGLPENLSASLARQTVIGAANLAAHTPETAPAILRQSVTSPGGTTEAALNILMNGHFDAVLKNAVQAATEKSRDLSLS